MIGPEKRARPLAALFIAEVISTTGSEMASIALPWFVLITSGSALQMGIVLAAQFAGMTLLGIPSGRAATVLGPRMTMLTSDLLRAPLMAFIPFLYWIDLLSFPLIVSIAFAVGAFFPAYSSAQRLVLTGLVGEDEVQLTRVSGLLGSVNETASFVGPAAGGLLVALFGSATTLMFDAGSYLVAFALVRLFVPSAWVRAPDEDASRGAMEGLRFLGRDRPLLQSVIGLGIIEIGWTAMVAALPVLALRRFNAGADLAGWFLASYGAGSVVGGLISARTKSTNPRMSQLAILGIAVSTWVLLAPPSPWVIGLAVGANGVFSGLFFPRFFAALTLRPPPILRARVMTSVTTVMSGPGPIGFVAAGFLLHASSSTFPAFVLTVITMTVGAFIVAASRFPGDESSHVGP